MSENCDLFATKILFKPKNKNNMLPTTDEITKQEIIDQLVWDDRIDTNKVYVRVQDGIVRLEGTVANNAAKAAAEKDSFLVTGVKNVENFLEVKLPPEANLPSDDVITENIENNLNWNSQINAANVRIKTTDGVVKLTGKVTTYWERKVAEEIAGNTNGVILVENELSVALIKSVEDAEIEIIIKNACKRNAMIDGDKINVRVKDGVVHFSGRVPNHGVKREINDIAIFTTGVKDIKDEMIID
jgi:osmotically-inducible protein OsmY